MLIFGAGGYVGMQVAKWAIASGFRVIGTTRHRQTAELLEAYGVEPVHFDGETPVPERFLEQCTHVLSAVPPIAGSDPVVTLHRKALCERVPYLRWVGYLSTTLVYTDTSGEWVDEDDEVRTWVPEGGLDADDAEDDDRWQGWHWWWSGAWWGDD